MMQTTPDGDALPVGVLYTGGTFGMVPSDRGYTPSSDLPERAQAALAGSNHPPLRWLDPGTGPAINSADVNPAFWHALAGTIRRNAAHCTGFVVIHGTDTLAFTGSALSFLLADLGRPVVVTGARAPLGEAASDARENLLTALHAAVSPGFTGTGLAFGGQLLQANRSSKRFGAPGQPFTSPNAAPLATFDGNALHWQRTLDTLEASLPVVTDYASRAAMLAVYPGISGDVIHGVVETGVHALLLETYPSGIGPGEDAAFVAAIDAATRRGVVVAAVSQNQYGGVRLGHYATSTPLAEAGLIGGADMTREAAFTKLHYLINCGLDRDAIIDAFQRNLCGELTATD
ncbi:asparaginase [Aquisalimonas asiatica]|nr:asparaginase [Aquisalimonas asiatica]